MLHTFSKNTLQMIKKRFFEVFSEIWPESSSNMATTHLYGYFREMVKVVRFPSCKSPKLNENKKSITMLYMLRWWHHYRCSEHLFTINYVLFIEKGPLQTYFRTKKSENNNIEIKKYNFKKEVCIWTIFLVPMFLLMFGVWKC